MCRDLPSADSEGTSDPFIIVWDTVEAEKRTKTLYKSTNPLFYEVLELEYIPIVHIIPTGVPEGIITSVSEMSYTSAPTDKISDITTNVPLFWFINLSNSELP